MFSMLGAGQAGTQIGWYAMERALSLSIVVSAWSGLPMSD
jgi:hypothetical protein